MFGFGKKKEEEISSVERGRQLVASLEEAERDELYQKKRDVMERFERQFVSPNFPDAVAMGDYIEEEYRKNKEDGDKNMSEELETFLDELEAANEVGAVLSLGDGSPAINLGTVAIKVDRSNPIPRVEIDFGSNKEDGQ